jgi:predicted RNA-binding Zn-ribbon protein involved in translation (DUF1610 family)
LYILDEKQRQYVCPECGEVSTEEEIDARTADELGDDAIPLSEIEEGDEDALVICPKCGEEVYAEDLEEVEATE